VHNSEKYYLSEVNYSTANLIFIRVNIYPGVGGGVYKFLNPFILSGSLILDR
jgi:hypothetical protein